MTGAARSAKGLVCRYSLHASLINVRAHNTPNFPVLAEAAYVQRSERCDDQPAPDPACVLFFDSVPGVDPAPSLSSDLLRVAA